MDPIKTDVPFNRQRLRASLGNLDFLPLYRVTHPYRLLIGLVPTAVIGILLTIRARLFQPCLDRKALLAGGTLRHQASAARSRHFAIAGIFFLTSRNKKTHHNDDHPTQLTAKIPHFGAAYPPDVLRPT